MKFSPANAKIQALSQVESLRPFLHNRKVYSFDILSGWSCPGARDCLSKVIEINGRRSIQDGPNTQFRCFSASQEATFPGVYNLRKHNYELMKGSTRNSEQLGYYISSNLPSNLGICRIHVGGDFFNLAYFLGWINTAILNPDRLFYAYTKSLSYWVGNLELVNSVDNFVLTASKGGRRDELIDQFGLRYAEVVFNEEEADSKGLEIDHDDSHAADANHQSFALLIHGTQPKGTDASRALQVLRKNNVRHSYSK